MIKKIIYIFILLNLGYLQAQIKTNVEDIFKMQLFLNKKNIAISSNDFKIKDNYFYDSFRKSISIKIDTLKVENKLTGLFEDEYAFYRVKQSGITYSRTFTNYEGNFLGISCGLNDFFILAMNKKTGTTYRLAGFDTNDFMGFLMDYKEMYLNSNSKKISTSKFLKNYIVQDLDFKCLYKGLKCGNKDSSKYPCLIKCNEPIRFGIETK